MFYNWKAKYGGLEVSKATRLRALEGAMLHNAGLKDLLSKNGYARCKA